MIKEVTVWKWGEIMPKLYLDYEIHPVLAKRLDCWGLSVRYFLNELGMDPDYAELLEYKEILYDGKPARAYSLFKFPLFIVEEPHKSISWDGSLHYRAELSGETSMWAINLKKIRQKKGVMR